MEQLKKRFFFLAVDRTLRCLLSPTFQTSSLDTRNGWSSLEYRAKLANAEVSENSEHFNKVLYDSLSAAQCCSREM